MTKAIGAIGLGNFAIGLGAFLVVGLLVPIARDMQVNTAEAGLMMVIYAASYALTSPILINVSGSWPRRRMLLGSLALMALGTLTCLLAPDWKLFLIGRALAAVGGGAYTPIAASTVYSLSLPARRGRNLAVIFLSMSLSQAAGIPFGIWLETLIGWRQVLVSVLALTLASSVAILLTTPGRISSSRPPTSFRLLLVNGRALVSLLLTVLQVSAYNVIYTYIGPLALKTAVATPMVMLLVIGISNSVGGLLVGPIADRFGPHRLLMFVLAAFAAILPVFSLGSIPIAVLLGATFAWGFTSGFFMVPQQMTLVRDAPDHQTLVLSLNATATYIGVALGSAVGGLVISRAGLDCLGLVASGIALAGLAIFNLHPGRRGLDG
ncbi:MFS transporter [Pontitalea aquivivens]|uniref:MFS transporter n=1 Tax=Pontitalea aquivivens TaxID=3388663 RepID=UPI003970482E